MKDERREVTVAPKRALIGPKRALIVVDVQNDFISGTLPVAGANDIIEPINQLLRSEHFDAVIFSRDSHPHDHVSFAKTHGLEPFTSIDLRIETERRTFTIKQELWPTHCVKGEIGWQFHPNLNTSAADLIVDKGESSDTDSYSAFFKRSEAEVGTELGRELTARGIEHVYCVGLAYDYCVGSTAIDAASHGFKTFVIDSLVRGVAPETCASMSSRMESAGVTIVHRLASL